MPARPRVPSEPPPAFEMNTLSGGGFGPLVNAVNPMLSREKAIRGRGTTATTAVAVKPPDVAVIVSPPVDTPLTRPVCETVATAGARDDHVAGTPMNP